MTKALCVFFALLAAAPGLSAQSLLPPSLGPATSSQFRLAAPAELPVIAREAAALLNEFGLTSIEQRSYTQGSGRLEVTLFRLRDSTSSYAFFQHRRGTLRPAGWTEHSAAGPDKGMFLLGEFVAELEGLAPASRDVAARELANHLKRVADKAPYPNLGDHLPARGLQAGSERYFLGPLALEADFPVAKGDWPGLANGAEAIVARYRSDGRELSLMLVIYPTPQAAGRKHKELARLFAAAESGERPAVVSGVFLRRIGSLLALAIGATEQAVAEKLLSEVSYEQQVTLNEPGFRADEPPMTVLIYSILVGTGLLLSFLFVASLAFGGVRLAIKRLLPGKVFDRNEDVEIIQLSLSSKPIEAKDFYSVAFGGRRTP